MTPRQHRLIDFPRVSRAALDAADTIVARWLPDGRRDGHEWTARNPRRSDRRPGSFRVNLRTGKWGDFATDDRGADLVSLAAFLYGLTQREAAIRIGEMLGVDPYER